MFAYLVQQFGQLYLTNLKQEECYYVKIKQFYMNKNHFLNYPEKNQESSNSTKENQESSNSTKEKLQEYSKSTKDIMGIFDFNLRKIRNL